MVRERRNYSNAQCSQTQGSRLEEASSVRRFSGRCGWPGSDVYFADD